MLNSVGSFMIWIGAIWMVFIGVVVKLLLKFGRDHRFFQPLKALEKGFLFWAGMILGFLVFYLGASLVAWNIFTTPGLGLVALGCLTLFLYFGGLAWVFRDNTDFSGGFSGIFKIWLLWLGIVISAIPTTIGLVGMAIAAFLSK